MLESAMITIMDDLKWGEEVKVVGVPLEIEAEHLKTFLRVQAARLVDVMKAASGVALLRRHTRVTGEDLSTAAIMRIHQNICHNVKS